MSYRRGYGRSYGGSYRGGYRSSYRGRRDPRPPRRRVAGLLGGTAIFITCVLVAVAIHVAGAIDRRDWTTLANYTLALLAVALLVRWLRNRRHRRPTITPPPGQEG